MIKLSLQNWAVIILLVFFTAGCNDSLQPDSKDRAVSALVSSTTNTSKLVATNVWKRVASFPIFKFGAAASFTIGETAYVGTGSGFNAGPTPTKDFWKYDFATDAWTQIADFGGGIRESAFGFSIGEKGYVGTGTGLNAFNQKDFWEYDPLTNQWTRKADFGGGVRYGATSFAIDTKGYVGAGASHFGETNPVGTIPPPTIFEKDLWEYDPSTDVWTRKADFRGAGRFHATSFVLEYRNTQLCYMGGGDAPGDVHYNDFWQYSPASDLWRKRADLMENFSITASFAIGSKGYTVSNGKLWMFDPLTSQFGNWIQKADFPEGVMTEAVGFSLNGQGYIVEGKKPSSEPFANFVHTYIPD